MRSVLVLFVAFGLFALAGCGKKEEEQSAQPISASINNNAPEAKNAPVAQRSGPGQLSGQLGGRGLKKGAP